MSENSVSADVTAEVVSDEQIDSFFESGGEVESQPEQQEEQQPEQQQEEQQQEADKTERQSQEEIENNYKRMAHEEREKRRQLEQQFKENQDRIARMEQVYGKLVEQHTQQNQPQAPSFDEDPLENLRYKQETIERQLQYQQQVEYQRQQQAEQQQKYSNFMNQYQTKVQEYATKTPDFTDAIQFLANTKQQEYLAAGHSLENAKRLILEDELALVSTAFNDGVNPGERLYNLAKFRGYSKQDTSSTNSNTAKMEQLERGVKAAKSLSNVGGKSTGGPPTTLEELALLSDDEIDKYWPNLIGNYS